MSKYRIQYKDKPVTLGGLVVPPYTFFINEQGVMTAYAETRNVHTDKAGHGYIRLKLLLSDQGRGFWYPALLYDNGRVAYISDKKFIRLRGLYPRVFDAFLSKFSTTEIKVAEERRDYEDDAKIFGDLPTMRQPQRCTDYVRYNDTRYQISKLSSSSDSSRDFNEFTGTHSGQSAFCYAWTGSLRPQVHKTKTEDFSEKKPIYAGISERSCEEVSAEKMAGTYYNNSVTAYCDAQNMNKEVV